MLLWSIAPICIIAAALSVRTGYAQPSDARLILVESSPFQMVLFPTIGALNLKTALKLEERIRESLLTSALSSSIATLSSVFDIDIILRDLTWSDGEDHKSIDDSPMPSTVLQFVVLATFLDEGEKSLPSPSRFAIDSLVIQTYSQLSSKFTFIEMLQLSSDPSLQGIDDVIIEPALKTHISSNSSSRGSGWSRFELFLICMSLSIFFGIAYVVFQYRKDRHSHWGLRFQSLNARIDDGSFPTLSRSDMLKNGTSVANPGLQEEPKKAQNEKLQSSRLPTSTDFSTNDPLQESPIRLPTISNYQVSDDLQSTPKSKVSSTSVPWSFSNPSSQDQDSCSPKTGDAYVSEGGSLCASSSVSSPISPLALYLPDLSKEAESAPPSPSLTCKSGDPGQFSSPALPLTLVAGEEDKMTLVDSVPVDQSSQSSAVLDSSCFSASTMTSDRRTTMDMIELGAKWVKMKYNNALDDDVDDGLEDPFQVDVDGLGKRDENESDSSGYSAVSAWMKSIRVVNSFETFTSSVTNSSTGESTVTHSKERLPEAADCSSLERSLADSIVEV